MAEISYFQRYSQKENHLTNNTLMMLQHIYRNSPAKLDALLDELLDGDVPIGVNFLQQKEVRKGSIPDGHIEQKLVTVFLETKRDSMDLKKQKQITRYVNDIIKKYVVKKGKEKIAGHYILIGIGKGKDSKLEKSVNTHIKKQMKKEIGETNDKVQFICCTFQELHNKMSERDICGEYETDLREILDDYESYLFDAGVLPPKPRFLAAFSSGDTMRENIASGVCYNDHIKKNEHLKFLGLYGGGYPPQYAKEYPDGNELVNKSGVMGYVGKVMALAKFSAKRKRKLKKTGNPKQNEYLEICDYGDENDKLNAAEKCWTSYDPKKPRHRKIWEKMEKYRKVRDVNGSKALKKKRFHENKTYVVVDEFYDTGQFRIGANRRFTYGYQSKRGKYTRFDEPKEFRDCESIEDLLGFLDTIRKDTAPA